MSFDDMKNKVQEFAGKHAEQSEEGIDKAKEFVDDKTDDKYADQTDQAAEKARQAFGGDQS
ncbi:MAG TPA: antitoxin [Pseudonocardiaceae bacterium]|nr:antitoxin [Pseudonocardiaceae bacterium]